MLHNDFEVYLKSISKSALILTFGKTNDTTPWTIKEVITDDYTTQDKAILLTISSHRFKVLVVLHFSASNQLDLFIKKKLNIYTTERLNSEQRNDFLCELLNVFCGHIKKELQQKISSLGMSIPNILDNASIAFIKSVDLQSEFYFQAQKTKDSSIHASFFTSIYGEIVIDETIIEDTSEVGVIEFF
jgi:mRNA-degrading endonuclease HigB of HigAB toxin-antitoxin module